MRAGVVAWPPLPLHEHTIVEAGEELAHVHGLTEGVDHGDDAVLISHLRQHNQGGAVTHPSSSHLPPQLGVRDEDVVVLLVALERLRVIDVGRRVDLRLAGGRALVRAPWLHVDDIEQVLRALAAHRLFRAAAQLCADLRPQRWVQLLDQHAEKNFLPHSVPLVRNDVHFSRALVLGVTIHLQQEVEYGVLDHEQIQCVEAESHGRANVEVLHLFALMLHASPTCANLVGPRDGLQSRLHLLAPLPLLDVRLIVSGRVLLVGRGVDLLEVLRKHLATPDQVAVTVLALQHVLVRLVAIPVCLPLDQRKLNFQQALPLEIDDIQEEFVVLGERLDRPIDDMEGPVLPLEVVRRGLGDAAPLVRR
mmetsp:Transcript_32997/g.94797  ORF Transcript_32997/g.94797 Transcript_32997/m.94797 type:complete len:363 (+) Transcript_32997:805-1893(+)